MRCVEELHHPEIHAGELAGGGQAGGRPIYWQHSFYLRNTKFILDEHLKLDL